MDDDSENKKTKGTKKCVIKTRLMFKKHKDCQSSNKIILKSRQRFKGNYHNVYTEPINKTARSSNDDKRLQILIKLQRIQTEQMHLKHAKARC